MGLILLVFGIINLFIYAFLKYDSVKAKVISIEIGPSIYKSMYTNQEILTIIYIINNKRYKQSINVSKNSALCQLYYSSLEKYINIEEQDFIIYVSKSFPKLIIDDIDRLKINFLVGIISILISIILCII